MVWCKFIRRRTAFIRFYIWTSYKSFHLCYLPGCVYSDHCAFGKTKALESYIMITVKEADKIIAHNIKEFPTIEMDLNHASGAILQEDIKADRDLPPFNKSLMAS